MSRVARLGAFIIVALAILVAGVFIIGSHRYLFSSTYQLKTQFDTVAGLDAGADVEVGGVHVGIVKSIEMPHRPGDKVTVVMQMNTSTHDIVKQDSMTSIETEGILGNQYMAVSYGSAGKPDVRNGDTIGSYPPLEMSDMIKKADYILDSTQQAVNNTTLLTANFKSISAKIDNGTGTAGALVNDKQLYNNMNVTMQQAQAGVTDFQENMEAMKHNFLLKGYFKSRGYEDAADLQENAIDTLPTAAPIKVFTYSAKELFDSTDSAKLKNQKTLTDGGQYLTNTQFGYAVIVASTGATGDSQKDLLLTQARAMVVRDYLVDNFGFDDSQLKTIGMGKQLNAGPDADWGNVQIYIYPVGAVLPTQKQNPASATFTEQPAQVSQTSTPK
jgi:phospholipid/cholesterol/gamma-HCH transport system substrate-binding protein